LQLDQQHIVAEIRRVAKAISQEQLSQRQFAKHSQISVSTVKRIFGSWNRAISASGLETNTPGPRISKGTAIISDEELLTEIIRLTQKLGKIPSEREMSAFGQYSPKPYSQRWQSFTNARNIAYAKYGLPELESDQSTTLKELTTGSISRDHTPFVSPKTYKPPEKPSKKTKFGEPIDFRGLRFAPINEQGIVYLFGIIARELGFLIESVRTEFPDCEGKRCVDTQRQMWEHILIEFEYRSKNFLEHGHNPNECDLIICWIHDWDDCPIEVLELRSQIQYLPK
jgi:hypothetical protein